MRVDDPDRPARLGQVAAKANESWGERHLHYNERGRWRHIAAAVEAAVDSQAAADLAELRVLVDAFMDDWDSPALFTDPTGRVDAFRSWLRDHPAAEKDAP